MRSLSCGERAILQQDGPEGDDWRAPTRVTERTARKAHTCDTCHHGGILAGERYTELVYLDHPEDGGFKIERHCRISGCKRSDEHLAWLREDRDRAMAEAYRREAGEHSDGAPPRGALS